MAVSYIRSPYNATDGIVVGYSVYPTVLEKYLEDNDLELLDLLYSSSDKWKKDIYNMAKEKTIYNLAQQEYDVMPENKRPLEIVVLRI